MPRKTNPKTGFSEVLQAARDARDALGITNADIGRMTGISTGQVGAVLSGKRNATAKTITVILAALSLELCVKPIEGGGSEAASRK